MRRNPTSVFSHRSPPPAAGYHCRSRSVLAFGALGLLLTIVGIFRGQVPMAPANIAVALLLGGGVWFVIAWAVATAAVDVESDVE